VQSELPFRLLCRQHGADAAYSPMLHARLFAESSAYREEHFTTCQEDRPLFVQFCANDPDILVRAASLVDSDACDYLDLNFGCPQRIAKRGNYGAFLMDDLARVESLVRGLRKVLQNFNVVDVQAERCNRWASLLCT
jgi:tRNA-dihydrouridine synthase 1